MVIHHVVDKHIVRYYWFVRRYFSFELPKAYDPVVVENFVKSQKHLSSIKPTTSTGKFSICLPPPNVTGNLHIGHALTIAIEDTIVRWRSMNGFDVRWIPGFDHAGIATQLVVEKEVRYDSGVSRLELGREQFLEKCSHWRQKKENTIKLQINRLNAKVDWDASYFTLDDKFSDAVAAAFVKLHETGDIIRQKRLVNWSPYLQSTVPEVEITSFEVNTPQLYQLPGDRGAIELGYIYYIKYPIHNAPSIQYLTVATTRPETIFADVAVAVNPADSRYSHLIGQTVSNPLLNGRIMPIIADDSVDPLVGTGVLKITPAHSFQDFAIGQRNQLSISDSCIDESGCLINANGLSGLSVAKGRSKTVDWLHSVGHLISRYEHPTSVPVCFRSGDLLEPMIKDQWFLDLKATANTVSIAIQIGELQCLPSHWLKVWQDWLSKADLWCLSRQIWWGHQVPAYYADVNDERHWVAALDSNSALRKLVDSGHTHLTIEMIHRDTDVLDTWFSSALIPLVVSGQWPLELNHDDSTNYCEYPLSLMETGHDILKFWVHYMTLLCTMLSGKLPFTQVLLHSIVRDSQGRKMSKSLGNVVDPVDIIDGCSVETLEKRISNSTLGDHEKLIAKKGIKSSFPKGILPCGSDALRFSLLSRDIKGQDFNLDTGQMHKMRAFCNKIWQAYRFTADSVFDGKSATILSLEDVWQSDVPLDRWLLTSLCLLSKSMQNDLSEYNFHLATAKFYRFWWFSLCDIYLECVKPTIWNGSDLHRIQGIQSTLFHAHRIAFALISPIMPNISQFLYYQLKSLDCNQQFCMQNVQDEVYPGKTPILQCDTKLINQMKFVSRILRTVRSARIELGIGNKHPLSGYLVSNDYGNSAYELFGFVVDRLAIAKFDIVDDVHLINGKNRSIPLVVDLNSKLLLNVDEDFDFGVAIALLEKQLSRKKKSKIMVLKCLEKPHFDEEQKNRFRRDIEHFNFDIDRISKLCRTLM